MAPKPRNRPLFSENRAVFWTLRRLLIALGLALFGIMSISILWLAETYKDFAVTTLEKTSRQSLDALVQERLSVDYLHLLNDTTESIPSNLDVATALIDYNSTKLNFLLQIFNMELLQPNLQLNSARFYDAQWQEMAHIGSKSTILQNPTIRQELLQKPILDQFKRQHFLWVNKEGDPLHSYILPIGEFQLLGFLEVVTDPMPVFKGLGHYLTGQIKVRNTNGQVIFFDDAGFLYPNLDRTLTPTKPQDYQSFFTPQAVYETVSVSIKSFDQQPWASISLTRDITDFMRKGQALRNTVFQILLGSLIFGTIFAAFILRRVVFLKLKQFAEAMRSISRGQIEAEIPPTGPDEMRIMANALVTLREAVRKVDTNVKQLHDILENSPVGVFIVCSVDQTIVYANSELVKLFNLDLGAIIGTHFDALPSPEIHQFVGDTLHNEIVTENKEELSITSFQGRLIWIKIYAKPILFDEKNAFIFWTHNITEQKQSLSGLQTTYDHIKKAEARLLDAIEALPHGFILWDTDDRLVIANSRQEKLSTYGSKLFIPGIKFPDLITKALSLGDIILPPETNLETWFNNRIAQHKEGTYCEEQRFPNGHWCLILEHKTQEGGLVCLTIDITDLKKREEILKNTNQRLELHIQQSPLAVIEWNLSFHITHWNPSASNIFGYSPEEIIGHLGTEFIFPPDQLKILKKDIIDLIGSPTKTAAPKRYTNITKDGREITCEWHNTPLIGTQGTVIGIASLIIDMTERLQTEKNLHIRSSFDQLLLETARQLIEQERENRLLEIFTRLGQFFQADRVFIFRTVNGKDFYKTDEWLGEDVPPQIDFYRTEDYEGYSWFYNPLVNGSIVVVPNLNQLPASLIAIRKHLQQRQIRSLITIPLMDNKKLIGIAGFHNIKENKAWEADGHRFFKILGELITLFITRRDSDKERHKLEASIQEQLSLFKHAISTIHQAIAVTDIDGRLVMWNDHFPQFLGLPCDGLDQDMYLFPILGTFMSPENDEQRPFKQIIQDLVASPPHHTTLKMAGHQPFKAEVSVFNGKYILFLMVPQ